MTNTEILTKTIQKAIEGGFKARSEDFKVDDRLIDWEVADGVKINIGYEQLVYMHDFAKALWGEAGQHAFGHTEPAQDGHKCWGWQRLKAAKSVIVPLVCIPTWQYHLQQMVISDDPIKYLGDNLK